MSTLRLAIVLAALVLVCGCGGTVDYGRDGVELQSVQDVAKLRDAPDGFRQYLAGRIDELLQAEFEKDCPPVVRVQAVDMGFATGSINGCGGYALIWKEIDGVWRQILGGQDYWRCADLRKHDVPVSVVHDGKCLEFRGGDTKVVPYPG